MARGGKATQVGAFVDETVFQKASAAMESQGGPGNAGRCTAQGLRGICASAGTCMGSSGEWCGKGLR